MSSVMKTMALVVLCTLIVALPSVWASWVHDGVALSTALGGQVYPKIISDGGGGAIVTWEDHRNGLADYDIYAQRVNASGAIQWTTDGVALCTATDCQLMPTITSDGAGGAFVTWYDCRNGNSDIYAQRVNASGAVLWTANGVALCTQWNGQSSPTITSDGVGGAIVTWVDRRNTTGPDIYAQRVNASGAVQWTMDGVALCTATSDQEYPTITSDGAGGAIVTWNDWRSGNRDIYAQRVNASGAIQWTTDGVALCTAANWQDLPQITSDGVGGAIVTWRDPRGGTYDIYAQRVNALGAVQWMADGVALCMATGDQRGPSIVSDGAGGAIVTWGDNRSLNPGVYAQRVNASGVVQWTTDGVALRTATKDEWNPKIISDGAGGAIVTWEDFRGGIAHDIYAQRVNALGTAQWTTDGVALCTATGDQRLPELTSDGAGGAVGTWEDYRGGSDSIIHAQTVDAHGLVGFLAPDILSVQDVPQDQGGRVRITIERSNLDAAPESAYPISMYNVWQRIDDPALLAMVAHGSGHGAGGARMNEAPVKHSVDALSVSGWPVKELNGRYFVQSKELLRAGAFPPGTWELLGSFAACQQDQYIYRASTLADSTASGIHYSVYVVSAHTTTPSVWFASAPDSGYSVDNIAPGPPASLAAEQSFTPPGLSLSWNVNPENDLSYYSVYRGLSEGFVPGPGNRVATPTAHEYFDGTWRWSSGYYYKVSAIDVHGNESGVVLLRPEDVTGTDTPKAPEASYLAQNYPNPFNPMTKVEFGLVAPGRVSLRIYDTAGRLVRVLAEKDRPAGRYAELWDGCDASGRAVASGVYFYRLDAGAFTQTRKMIMIR